MNWIDIAITAGFWLVGIALARRRGLPTRRQVVFTVVMWAGMLVGALFQKRNTFGLDEFQATGALIIFVLIVVAATSFPRKFFTPQAFAAIGMLLIFSSFMMTGYVVTFAIYALAGAFLLGSSILVLRKRPPTNQRY